MKTQRIATLLKREWLQHKWSWSIPMLVLVGLVWALMLSLPTFSSKVQYKFHAGGSTHTQVGVEVGEAKGAEAATLPQGGAPQEDDLGQLVASRSDVTALLILVGVSWGFAMLLLVTSTSIVLFQMPGLPRRDRADRSHEFWLSLPATHVESLGSTWLAHGVLVPMAAVLVGAACGLLTGMVGVVQESGFGALMAAPWWGVLQVLAVGALRLLLGVALMALWWSPFVFALMLAQAWVKGWGAPLLIGVTVAAAALLQKLYGYTALAEALQAQLMGGVEAVAINIPNAEALLRQAHDASAAARVLVGQLGADTWSVLNSLASVQFPLSLGVAALCFAGLVQWRRRA
ncbi:hypothetical protein ACG0Z6_04380 [Roseateles sp. BYS180W]|uniref:ABC transporter permease n=1 Tax=Roseateles rivi TaxID=3299028 RepID=A0ABW7FT24_9BURK